MLLADISAQEMNHEVHRVSIGNRVSRWRHMDNQQDNPRRRPADPGAGETATVAAQARNERSGAMPLKLVLTEE